MGRLKLAVPFVMVLVLALLCSGCFTSTTSSASTALTPVKPQPKVLSVTATTSGTQSSYFATLDIKVKNNGAEGTIMVRGHVTQNGKTGTNEMPVFLMKNETHELKLTFPLVWEGGEFTTNVEAYVP